MPITKSRTAGIFSAGWMAAALVAPQIASAADSNLCVFLKKGVAASKGEFASLKGDLDTTLPDNNVLFHGSLALPSGGICTVAIRRWLDDKKSEMLTPTYDCTVAEDQSYDNAEALYTAAANAIKACLPAWNFKELKKGDRNAREEVWQLDGDTKDAKIELGFVDYSLLDGTGPNKVHVTLRLEDSAPPAKGAIIPMMK